jgi:roadblock/LC7 domain-containing protein
VEKEGDMATLDELMSLPGVYGALEFSCTGELGQMRGDVDRDFAEMIAQMCATNMAMYRMQATGWTKLTGQQGFLPERGFAFVALDQVVMGMNGNAVLARRKDFDYDAAYRRFSAA